MALFIIRNDLLKILIKNDHVDDDVDDLLLMFKHFFYEADYSLWRGITFSTLPMNLYIFNWFIKLYNPRKNDNEICVIFNYLIFHYIWNIYTYFMCVWVSVCMYICKIIIIWCRLNYIYSILVWRHQYIYILYVYLFIFMEQPV